ncbi:GPI inositol-deacylase [Holothuria leucospilota]|uniref:GPI inositol-deacylase n=1 Tax=Holothuria leucospilota TaxID=206669 RepID=A0A9Q1H9R4_HOLLE|nr:GPI inositol-deacylase [Holothuria leucospilota]
MRRNGSHFDRALLHYFIYYFTFHSLEFVHECIQHILSLYSEAESPPSSVVLVGHSMYWKDEEKLNHVTVLSVGGGHRDVMVKSANTGLNGVVSSSRHISAVSTSIPHVWEAADHLCIVWCNELVLATKRALFEMIDPKTSLLTEDPDLRMKIFRYHFSDHSGWKKYQEHKEDIINFKDKKDVNFKLAADSRLHIATNNKDKLFYYLFPVPSPKHGFVATTKIPAARWVFLCTKATDTTCDEGIDITMRGRVAPPLRAGVREIHLSPEDLKGHDFLVIRVPSGSAGVINAEMYDWEERHFEAELPAFFSMAPQTIVNMSGPTYISIGIDLTSVSTAYVAELVPEECPASVQKGINTTLRFEVPWKQEDTYSVASVRQNHSLSLKLQSGRPPNADNTSMPRLSAYLDPRCQYAITLRYSQREGYGQIVRFYGHTIPTMMVIIIILATSYQLKHLYLNKPLESFSKLHDLYCKPYVVVPPIALFRAIVKSETLEQSYDFRTLTEQGIFFNFLPLVMFLLSYGFCALFVLGLENKPNTGGRFWKWWKKGELSLEAFKSQNSSEQSRIWSIAVVGAVIAIAFGTCAAVAAMVLSLFLGLKAAGLKAKFLVAESKVQNTANKEPAKEDEQKKPTKDEEVLRQVRDNFYYVFTVLTLLNFLILIVLPSFLAWMENIKFNYRLQNDPALYPVLLACVSVIDVLGNPRPLPQNSKLTKPVSWILYLFTMLLVLYAIDSVYRCAYFLSMSMLLLSFLQLF